MSVGIEDLEDLWNDVSTALSLTEKHLVTLA
jgi:cystathionine beta-lyase/cystathionine gamma-synthase